jgi:glycosyltransferase involved in cell wall biosynthesis
MSNNNLVFLQTIQNRLDAVRNDYSDCESLFQSGAELPLVDTRSTKGMSAEDVSRFERTRAAYVRPILYGGARVPGIALVIPVFGDATLLAESLLSISRQTFVQQRPANVQVIVVEDGIPPGESSVFSDSAVDGAVTILLGIGANLSLLRLRSNHGRAQARNVGLSKVTRPLVLFVDASIILEPDFVTEHVWRHARLQRTVALLGFKENLNWGTFVKCRTDILSGAMRPDFQKDLKWAHVLTDDEAGELGFEHKGQRFRARDTINYMRVTDNFKALTGTESVGVRTLPSFFQTNIVSVPTHSVKEVGGFVPEMQGWGLEDTLLGALLVASGCKLIPCPTSVAFNLERASAPVAEKAIDLWVNRTKYEEFISKTSMDLYSTSKFDQNVRFLKDKIEVVETASPKLTSSVTRKQRLLEVPNVIEPGGRGKRLAEVATVTSKEAQEKAAQLIEQHRRAYADGRMVESLARITEACRLTPNDTYVAYRYAVVLMRLCRHQAVDDLLVAAKEKGLYDDAIKGLEGEYLRRKGEPEIALKVLETVQNPEYYNVAYEKGMCNLLLYSQRKRMSDLLQALAHLRDARRSHPEHWWVTTNLAVATRVIGQQDDALEQIAIKQLEDTIQKHPLKASARIYRLLYYVMRQDADRLAATIAEDHESCPSTMEVACDFFDTVQKRVALICPDPVVAERFMEALKRWPLPFTLLHI